MNDTNQTKESQLKVQSISVNIADPESNLLHTFNLDILGMFKEYQTVCKQRDDALAKMDAMSKAGEWMFDNLKAIDGTTNGVMPSRQAWINATDWFKPIDTK